MVVRVLSLESLEYVANGKVGEIVRGGTSPWLSEA